MTQRQHARQEDATAAAQVIADATGRVQYIVAAPYFDGARWDTGYDVVEWYEPLFTIARRDPQTVEIVA